jgi:hypothetical protein
MAQPARERLLEAAARLIRERGMARVTKQNRYWPPATET